MSNRKKKVLVYRAGLLGLSETFIKEQVRALQEWEGVLLGHRIVPNGLDVGELKCLVLGEPARFDLLAKVKRRLRRRLDHADRREVAALSAEGPTLVHVHFGVDAVALWPVVRALGVPMIVTLHGYDINTYREWWESGQGGWWMRDYPERLLKLAHAPQVRFIAVSDVVLERAVEFGIPKEKITRLYIGIDTGRFACGPVPIDQRKLRVLFVGRLVENKGCRILLEAMKDVQADLPLAELIVVGDGPLRGDLERTALDMALNAQFRGALAGSGVRAEMDQARVFCLPSITIDNGQSESFGLVILEAQACGVPVVTSARGGAREGICEGVTGHAFAERDVAALATHLRRLLTDDGLALSMSRQGPKFVSEHFELADCNSKLERYYDAVAEGGVL